MVARIPLVISGIDFTEALNRTGYVIEYEERVGRNSFLSLAGTYDLDLLRYAVNIYWPLNALTLDEIRQLRAAALRAVYVPVNYLDLDEQELGFDYFHAVFGQINVPLITNTGMMIKDGALLTLKGR